MKLSELKELVNRLSDEMEMGGITDLNVVVFSGNQNYTKVESVKCGFDFQSNLLIIFPEYKLVEEVGGVMKKQPFEHYAKQVLKEFDFEKVHKAMIATNWHWVFGYDEDKNEIKGVPTVDTLKNRAIILLRDAYKSGNSHSTGGFMAGWENDEMYLSFILEDFST